MQNITIKPMFNNAFPLLAQSELPAESNQEVAEELKREVTPTENKFFNPVTIPSTIPLTGFGSTNTTGIEDTTQDLKPFIKWGAVALLVVIMIIIFIKVRA